MLIIFKLFIIQLVSTFFMITTLHAVQPNQHSSLTILDSKVETDTALQIKLNERENGLELSLRFEVKDEKTQTIPDPLVEPGGDFSLYLDGINVHRQSYSGEKISTSHTLPFSTIQDGEHTLRCELRTTMGKLLEQEVVFKLNTSPTITIEENTKDGSILFDPVVSLGFIDKEGEITGHLDVHVDEHFIATVPITQADNNKTVLLSKLLKKQLPITMLPQGNHLLRLMARENNGSTTIQYAPFSIDMTPRLEIKSSEDGKLKEINAYFVVSPEGFSGTLDIYYQQNLIFSRKSQGEQLYVTRADIISALEKHKYSVPTEATSFVISISAVNGSEEWQEVIF